MKNNLSEETTGISHVDGNNITITDVKKFTKHVDKRMKELQEEKQQPTELKILEVSLAPIHLACLDDDNRPNFKLIEIKNNIATSTNGHIIVKVDLSMNGGLTPDMLQILNGKYIHMEVWKEIQKCDSLQLDDDQIICNKKGINKIFEYSNPNGEFFKMENIIQDLKEKGEEPKRLMAYNPKFIDTIASIFKHEQLCFSFSKGNAGTFVFPFSGSGMFAVLMPIECAENRYFFI